MYREARIFFFMPLTSNVTARDQWRQALDASGSERLRQLRVGHTCSEPPDRQEVEVR
jgi:hypothetical protein